jgi:hypothetical protein
LSQSALLSVATPALPSDGTSTPSTKLRSGRVRVWLEVVSTLRASTNLFRINRHLLNICDSTYNQYTGVSQTGRAPPPPKSGVFVPVDCLTVGPEVSSTWQHTVSGKSILLVYQLSQSLSSSGCHTKRIVFCTNLNILHPRPCIVSQMPEVSDIHPTRQQKAHVSALQCFGWCSYVRLYISHNYHTNKMHTFIIKSTRYHNLYFMSLYFAPTCFNPRGSSAGGSMPVPG